MFWVRWFTVGSCQRKSGAFGFATSCKAARAVLTPSWIGCGAWEQTTWYESRHVQTRSKIFSASTWYCNHVFKCIRRYSKYLNVFITILTCIGSFWRTRHSQGWSWSRRRMSQKLPSLSQWPLGRQPREAWGSVGSSPAVFLFQILRFCFIWLKIWDEFFARPRWIGWWLVWWCMAIYV